MDISTFLVSGYLASQKCLDIHESRYPTIRIPHLYLELTVLIYILCLWWYSNCICQRSSPNKGPRPSHYLLQGTGVLWVFNPFPKTVPTKIQEYFVHNSWNLVTTNSGTAHLEFSNKCLQNSLFVLIWFLAQKQVTNWGSWKAWIRTLYRSNDQNHFHKNNTNKSWISWVRYKLAHKYSLKSLLQMT